MTKKKVLFQSIRFGLVGILNTIVGYGAYFILLNWFNYLIALVISHVVGVTHSFFWNKYWTFKSSGKVRSELAKFILVYTVSFAVNLLLLGALVGYYKINPRIAQAFVLSLTTCISFIGHRFWSFHYEEEG